MKKIFSLMLTVAVVSESAAQKVPPLSRQLLTGTIQIECVKTNGQPSTGTGFFFSFDVGTNAEIPVIVSCWHVISESQRGELAFRRDPGEAPLHVAFTNAFEKVWIRHPDTNIDLAILPIGHVLKAAEHSGRPLRMTFLNEFNLPTAEAWEEWGAFVDVKMIGYPIGLSDQKNRLPIIRRGISASDPMIDFNGESVFLIDAAVVPGSSGSPVLLADEISFQRRGERFGFGARLKLLGVLSAGYYRNEAGKIEVVEAPSDHQFQVNTRHFINIGRVIKAERLLDFKAVLPKK